SRTPCFRPTAGASVSGSACSPRSGSSPAACCARPKTCKAQDRPMLAWDRQLESWLVGHRIGPLDPVFQGLTYAGVMGALWLGLAAVAAVALRRWQVLAWVAAADVVAQVTTALIQSGVGRHRPRVH